MTMKSDSMRGIRDAAPIMVAYFPIAVTFGVVSVGAGFPWIVTVLISVCVYAGGAQFMLVSLAASGASLLSTIATVLLVNLRHFLYGTTLGPAVRSWPEAKKWIAAFGLTDEVFAVTSSRALHDPPAFRYQFMFSFSCYGSWVAGTAVGAGIGGIIPVNVSQTLSFALPALFLALLCNSPRTVAHWVAALCGAAVAVAASLQHFGSVGIIAGSITGATIGMLIQNRLTKRYPVTSNPRSL